MYSELERAFAKAAYTIKGGEVVVKDGEVVATPLGATHWVKSEIPEALEAELMKDIEAGFKDYYTVNLANYPVEDAYLPTGRPLTAEGRWR